MPNYIANTPLIYDGKEVLENQVFASTDTAKLQKARESFTELNGSNLRIPTPPIPTLTSQLTNDVPFETGFSPTRFKPLYTDFLSLSNLSPFVGSAISGGTISAQNGTGDRTGIVRVSDSTTAGGGYRFATGTVASDVTAIRIQGGELFELAFRWIDTRTTSFGMYGLLDSITSALPVDGVYARLDGTATGFSLGGRTSTASVESSTLVGENFVGTANVWYNLRVALNTGATLATFTILDAVRSPTPLWEKTLSTNIPTGTANTLVPSVGTFNSNVDAGAGMVDYDWTRFSINRTLAR